MDGWVWEDEKKNAGREEIEGRMWRQGEGWVKIKYETEVRGRKTEGRTAEGRRQVHGVLRKRWKGD